MRHMRGSLLNVPHVNRRVFKQHFLNSVHCEIELDKLDVQTIFSAEQQFREKFQSHGFLETKKVVHGELHMEVSDSETPLIQQKTLPIGLMFISQKPKCDLQITENKIIVSDYAYSGFEDFLAKLKLFVLIVEELLGKRAVKKIGFRKVNSLLADPVESYADACAIFNPALFGLLRSGVIAADALSATEEIFSIKKENMMCILKHRFVKREDREKAYEASLDYDLIDKTVSDTAEALESTLPRMNEMQFDLFMWAVTNEMIKLMEH